MQVSSHQEESFDEVDAGTHTIYPCLETQGQLGDSLDNPAGWQRLIDKQNYLIGLGYTELWTDHESLMQRAGLFDPKRPMPLGLFERVREQTRGLNRRCKWYISGWLDTQTPAHEARSREATRLMRTELDRCFDFVGLRFAYGHEGKILSAKTTNKYWAADYSMTDKYQLVYVNTPYNKWETAWLLDNTSTRSFMRPVRRCWTSGQIPIIYLGNDCTEATLNAVKQTQAIIAKG